MYFVIKVSAKHNLSNVLCFSTILETMAMNSTTVSVPITTTSSGLDPMSFFPLLQFALWKKKHMVAFKDIILHFSLSTTFFFLTIYQNYIFFATDWAIDAFRVCFITLIIEIPYAAPKCRAVSGIRFYNLTNLFWNWVYYKNPFTDKR